MTKRNVTALWLVAMGAAAAGPAIALLGAPTVEFGADTLGFSLIASVFATTGYFISTKRPGHRIGLLYLVSGVVGGLFLLLTAYSITGKIQGWPGYWAGWVLEPLLYFPWILSMVALPIILFPDGRLPTVRWRWVKWASYTLLAILIGGYAIFPEVDSEVGDVRLIERDEVTLTESGVLLEERSEEAVTPMLATPAGDILFQDGETTFITESNLDVLTVDGSVSNPFALEVLEPVAPLEPVLGGTAMGLMLALLAAAPIALITRFRRSDGIERQQMKWLVYPAAVAGVGLISTYTLDAYYGTWWHQTIILIALIGALAIPVATGMAIVRYRLYDIDRLISRTVVYAVLVALLAGVFIAIVFLLSQFLPDDNSFSVALSTLTVAALFNPLRRRIQEFIDRRLYRSRYDAREIAEEFSSRLTDQVDMETIHDELLEVVDETVKPEAAAVWIRDPRD